MTPTPPQAAPSDEQLHDKDHPCEYCNPFSGDCAYLREQAAPSEADDPISDLIEAAMTLEREQGANAGMDESSRAWQRLKSAERRARAQAAQAQPNPQEGCLVCADPWKTPCRPGHCAEKERSAQAQQHHSPALPATFNEACAALPEGVSWGDALTPAIAQHIIDSRNAALPGEALTDGELWSWVRSVMSQGASIQQDYSIGCKYPTYEHYSSRLDAAAAERADEFAAQLRASVAAPPSPVPPGERSVADIPDADLLRRVVRSLVRNRPRRKEFAWAAVSEAFALGSTFATQLCRRFDIDPDTGASLAPTAAPQEKP